MVRKSRMDRHCNAQHHGCTAGPHMLSTPFPPDGIPSDFSLEPILCFRYIADTFVVQVIFVGCCQHVCWFDATRPRLSRGKPTLRSAGKCADNRAVSRRILVPVVPVHVRSRGPDLLKGRGNTRQHLRFNEEFNGMQGISPSSTGSFGSHEEIFAFLADRVGSRTSAGRPWMNELRAEAKRLRFRSYGVQFWYGCDCGQPARGRRSGTVWCRAVKRRMVQNLAASLGSVRYDTYGLVRCVVRGFGTVTERTQYYPWSYDLSTRRSGNLTKEKVLVRGIDLVRGCVSSSHTRHVHQ